MGFRRDLDEWLAKRVANIAMADDKSILRLLKGDETGQLAPDSRTGITRPMIGAKRVSKSSRYRLVGWNCRSVMT